MANNFYDDYASYLLESIPELANGNHYKYNNWIFQYDGIFTHDDETYIEMHVEGWIKPGDIYTSNYEAIDITFNAEQDIESIKSFIRTWTPEQLDE